MSKWEDLLDRRPPARQSTDVDLPDNVPDEPDFAPPPDPKEYKPWILQRGGRPALFIDLRRFEPKSGMLIGTLMSYPQLIAVDYIGEQMLSLDFGRRQFVVEGSGLSELPRVLQQGMVLAIQERCPRLWPSISAAQLVSRITSVPT